jgi:hypothetical protein
MLSRHNLVTLLTVLVVITALMIGWGAPASVEGAALEPAAQETPPAAEGTPVHLPAEPGDPGATPPEEGTTGRLWPWLLVGAAGLVIAIAVVVAFVGGSGKGEEAPPAEVISVPITTVAEDAKGGRISRIVVSGEELRILRTDGVEVVSHKEPTAEITQLLTNLGVTPEMLSKIIIEVETPAS